MIRQAVPCLVGRAHSPELFVNVEGQAIEAQGFVRAIPKPLYSSLQQATSVKGPRKIAGKEQSMHQLLRIELLGGLRVHVGERTLTRFTTRKNASLLAYLAYFRHQSHPREVLIDLLWPDCDLATGRDRLSTALSSLRRILQSSDAPAGALLQADHFAVGLNPAAVITDVAEFQAALHKAAHAAQRSEQAKCLRQALESYGGELLPGHYEEWVLAERRRLDALYERASHWLDTCQDDTQTLDFVLPNVVSPESAVSHSGDHVDASLTPSSVSLPPQFTRFFGREDAISRLVALLSPHGSPSYCLVTLSGPGGSGKTRLAVEAARQAADRFAGGVWFVPLADLSDPRLLTAAIGDTLGLSRSGSLPSGDQLVAFLRDRGGPVLLVLDNFEQLVEGGAEVAQNLLERAPMLTCLVTSRRVLGLSHEQEMPVPPLPIPEPGREREPENLIRNESVRLFLDRVQRIRPDVQVTQDNAAAIGELVHRLEGIPLAIELAAARAQVLTPAQMLGQVQRRFDFLISRKQDWPERHRRLWSAIEWSYRLLSLDLQEFFARLAVFRGGWTAEAAEAVCAEPQALDYLEHLKECSLVLAETTEAGVRFRMLETLREYGWEQLDSEERKRVQIRHAQHYLALAQTEAPRATLEEYRVWLDRLECEMDNFRVALERGLEAEASGEITADLVWHLRELWWPRSYFAEMVRWIKRVVDRGERACSLERQAQLLRSAGVAARDQSHQESVTLFERSAAIFRELGNTEAFLGCRYWIAQTRGDVESLCRLSAQVSALRQERGDNGSDPFWVNGSMMAADSGDFALSRELAEQALHRFQSQGDWPGAANTFLMLGYAAHEMGDLAAARAYYEQAAQSLRTVGNRRSLAIALASLGEVACTEGNYAEAARLYRESLTIKLHNQDELQIVLGLEDFASLAQAQGQPERAARLYAAAAQWNGGRWYRTPATQQKYEKQLAGVRTALGETDYRAAWEAGSRMTRAEAVAYALEETA